MNAKIQTTDILYRMITFQTELFKLSTTGKREIYLSLTSVPTLKLLLDDTYHSGSI